MLQPGAKKYCNAINGVGAVIFAIAYKNPIGAPENSSLALEIFRAFSDPFL